ncbi:MAG: DUF4091 domain-containing protein [Clostridiales bacterium]|nr:DUF4091 domain-containing protein [Clostridiales bacterium]
MLKCISMSSMAKVFADKSPKDEAVNKFSLLKNERLSFQTALYLEGNETQNVSFEIKGSLKNYITAYFVEAIPSKMTSYKDSDDYYIDKNPGLFPDLLRPLGATFDLEANKWASIWFEFEPGDEIPAGPYKVEVDFMAEKGGKCTVVTELEIIDALLPKQELIHTNWFHTDCLATWYKVEVFSEDYWEIVENYVKNAVRHGLNFILTPLFTPPLDTEVGGERPTVQLVDVFLNDGEYSFGFEKLDRWVDMCERCGIDYYEMSHLYTQWGAKHAPKIMATVDGKEKKLFGWNTWAGGKAYSEFLEAFAKELIAFIEAKGIGKRVYFHVSDEPSAHQFRTYKKRAEAVEKLFPGYPVVDALSDYKFYKRGVVQTPIPATDHIDPFIGNVPELWAYYCCSQHRHYVSNRFFAMPSQRNRVLGFQLYKFDVKGFLHWGYNFWYSQYSKYEINPFEVSDAGQGFPSGDAYVVYPGDDGKPLNSLRLKVFYDAFQDLQALQLLESLIGREKTLALLEDGLDEEISFRSYPRSEKWQLDKREQINKAIKENM